MKEPAKAALIAGGGFALLAIAVGLATRTKPSSSSNGTGTAPPDGIGASPALPTITRESCLECVEKHLSAALVLCAEERDGYPYRWRVIGHLHEAEDESQAWPALHDAIRQARKTYQQTKEPPNFEALAELASRIQ